MRTTAIDRQGVKKLRTKETIGFLIAMFGIITILGIVLGAILKIQ